jgi:adenylate cyclase
MISRLGRGLTMLYLALASVLLAWALDQTKLFRLIALKSADLQYIATRPHVPDEITLIVVDQKTMDAFSEPRMFWHGYFAEAIEAAAASGARVMGLDLAFPIPVEKYAPGLDQRLASAVIETSTIMPVICAYAGTTMQKQSDWPVPMNMAAAALGQMAYVNLTADEDDFIRSIELVEASVGDQPRMQSMALAVAEKYAGRPPACPSRLMTIRYAGPAGTIRRVSLVDFLEAARAHKTALLRSWVGGKAVLLGTDEIADRHATPYYAFRVGSPANTAGVEIHANALDTLLTGRFLQKTPLLLNLALMLLAALLFSITTLRTTGWRLIVGHTTLTAILLLGTHVSFRAGWIVPASSLLLTAVLAFLLSLVAGSLTVARNRDALRNAMRLFVGREVADDVESTGKVGLSGRREFVTVLFSDIRGFTTFSETHEPETVVARLNEYLSTMTALIVRHGGTVNKFIGDGILAVFSGETPGTQRGELSEGAGSHTVRAVHCALEMVGSPSPFETRIGIHSGYAIVGNIGSSDKLEYTVLGDTVNLASRLEGLNKHFSTNVLFSGVTRELLGEGIAVHLLGEANVKGRNSVVPVYTVARGDRA